MGLKLIIINRDFAVPGSIIITAGGGIYACGLQGEPVYF
jgi:hypothetical protein